MYYNIFYKVPLTHTYYSAQRHIVKSYRFGIPSINVYCSTHTSRKKQYVMICIYISGLCDSRGIRLQMSGYDGCSRLLSPT